MSWRRIAGYFICLAVILAFRWEIVMYQVFYDNETNPIQALVVVGFAAYLLQLLIGLVLSLPARLHTRFSRTIRLHSHTEDTGNHFR